MNENERNGVFPAGVWYAENQTLEGAGVPSHRHQKSAFWQQSSAAGPCPLSILMWAIRLQSHFVTSFGITPSCLWHTFQALILAAICAVCWWILLIHHLEKTLIFDYDILWECVVGTKLAVLLYGGWCLTSCQVLSPDYWHSFYLWVIWQHRMLFAYCLSELMSSKACLLRKAGCDIIMWAHSGLSRGIFSSCVNLIYL